MPSGSLDGGVDGEYNSVALVEMPGNNCDTGW